MKCNASSILGRRAFLQLSGLAAVGTCLDPLAAAATGGPQAPSPTHVLHIRKGQVELAPGRLITTTTYDGQLPGPLLRATVGQRVCVLVYNETDSAERIFWHGQTLADEVASFVPAHSLGRMEFIPARPGLYFYHSHVVAAANLQAGLYSGQVGALLVEPRNDPGRYDRESVVVLKGCEPFLRRTGRGCEVGYASHTLNGRIPGPGTPLRINIGERVLLHVLNAGATDSCSLELPGHSFEVIALDGNPVPSPARVAALHLSPAERVSAYVTITQPAGWVVRELAGATSDYRCFGSRRVPGSAEPLEMVLTRQQAARSGFNRWSINGTSFSTTGPQPVLRVQHGVRYRLKIHNTSDEIIPVHLQHHRLQLVSVARMPAAGILKDVVTIGARQEVEVDFLADGRGSALLRCTRQLHADFGLMARLDYA